MDLSGFSGLGSFGLLPAELRIEIWQHFSSIASSKRLTILRTSRQLRAEATPFMYQNLVYCIKPLYQYLSGLQSNQPTSPSNFSFQRIDKGLSEADDHQFNTAPYQHLRKIFVDIEAPNSDDPAQVICLYRKCVALAEMLEAQGYFGLPKIQITFLDSSTDNSKWASDGKSQQSIRSFAGTDIQLVACSFACLCKIKFVKFHGLASREDALYTANITRLMMLTNEYHKWQYPILSVMDKEVRMESHRMFADVEALLDDVPGETANKMRLDRFSTWSADIRGHQSLYAKRCRSIQWDYPYTKLSDPARHRFQWRELASEVFNPRSKPFWELQLTLNQFPHKTRRGHHDVTTYHEVSHRGLVSKRCSQDVWHRFYPNGLPPYGSADFFKTLYRDLEPSEAQDDEVLVRDEVDLWVKRNPVKGWECSFGSYSCLSFSYDFSQAP